MGKMTEAWMKAQKPKKIEGMEAGQEAEQGAAEQQQAAMPKAPVIHAKKPKKKKAPFTKMRHESEIPEAGAGSSVRAPKGMRLMDQPGKKKNWRTAT